MKTRIGSRQCASLAIEAAIDQKALDPKLIDIQGRSDIADFFVVVSGTSERHVKGIVDKIERQLLAQGEKPLSVSGYEAGTWVVLDYMDTIVHVFYEPVRHYYEFDSLWKREQELPLEEDVEPRARRLRTGAL